MSAGKGRRRWQVAEMELARACGTERLPNNGFGQPDFIVPATDTRPQIAVQVKTRASMPQWFLDAMDQATLDADGLEGDAIPCVAYVYAPGSGIKKRRYITLRFEDAVQLLGTNKATPPDV
jgi:hypothetical protein